MFTMKKTTNQPLIAGVIGSNWGRVHVAVSGRQDVLFKP